MAVRTPRLSGQIRLPSATRYAGSNWGMRGLGMLERRGPRPRPWASRSHGCSHHEQPEHGQATPVGAARPTSSPSTGQATPVAAARPTSSPSTGQATPVAAARPTSSPSTDRTSPVAAARATSSRSTDRTSLVAAARTTSSLASSCRSPRHEGIRSDAVLDAEPSSRSDPMDGGRCDCVERQRSRS